MRAVRRIPANKSAPAALDHAYGMPGPGTGPAGQRNGTERCESAPVCAHYNPVEIRRSCSDGTCSRLVGRGVLAGVVSPALQALRGRRAMRVPAAHQRGGLRRQLRHEGLDQGKFDT